MFEIIRRGTLCLILLATLASVSILEAQQAVEPASAPVPAQITSAKRVFIANAGGDGMVPDIFSHGRDFAYNQFYGAMKSWGRFEVVGTPSDADVVFEISLNVVLGGDRVMSGSTVGLGYDTQLKLVIRDPKTNVKLWAFNDHVEGAGRKGNRDKNLDQAIAKVVEETKSLVAPAAAVAEKK